MTQAVSLVIPQNKKNEFNNDVTTQTGGNKYKRVYSDFAELIGGETADTSYWMCVVIAWQDLLLILLLKYN